MKQEKINVETSLVLSLTSLRNELNKQIKKIDQILPKLTSPDNKFKCPYCQSRDVRININSGYCRRCGEKSERIGNSLFQY